MSIIQQIILDADEELRYPTPGELRAIQRFCKTGESRIQLAQTLAQHAPEIVERGTRKFWQICPQTPSNSGSAQKTASAKRDMGWYIRLISYCLLAGSDRPLRTIGLLGMKELYTSIGIPLDNILKYLRCLKDEAIALLCEPDAAEIIPYFDQIIQELVRPGPSYFGIKDSSVAQAA